MTDGLFPYEDCLLKHHVRTTAWLPICRQRLTAIRKAIVKEKDMRRLKYFTFCAVGAIDVLMLDVARVIVRSQQDKFDTVFFFERQPDNVKETQKRIPGSVGFPGDFVYTVLLDDPDEDASRDGLKVLEAPSDKPDERGVRADQITLAQRRLFVRSFPFDVINLDLEGYLFKPTDTLPGRLINAMRKVFAWQCQPFREAGTDRPLKGVNGFSLMFTTKVGPHNLGDDYLTMLRDRLHGNLETHPELKELFLKRTGADSVATLQGKDFELFFKLAMPKILASTLMEEDWCVDPEPGIQIFEFERPSPEGAYKMLHLVMAVNRKVPPKGERAPGVEPEGARDSYLKVTQKLLVEPEVVVTEASIERDKLQVNLDRIKARRKMYYPEDTYNGPIPGTA
jgi:hypothetical protein